MGKHDSLMNNNDTFPLFYLTVMLKDFISRKVSLCLWWKPSFFCLNSHPSCFHIVWRCTVCWFTTNCHIFLTSSTRAWGRRLSALIWLFGGLLLRPPLLDQNLQAGAEAGRGVHQAEEERRSRLRNLPALRLRQGPFLQGVERRNLLHQI